MSTAEQDKAPALLSSGMFESIPEPVRRGISEHCVWKSFEPHSMIVCQDDIDHDVLFVHQGLARATSYSSDGKQVVYRDIRPGDVIGDFSAIDGIARSSDVVAVKTTVVAIMRARRFWELLERHPTFMAAQLRHMSGVLRAMTARIFELNTQTVRTRVQMHLLRIVSKNAPGEAQVWVENLPPAHEFAAQIGAEPEAVALELGRLEAAGILRFDIGRNVKVNVLRLELDMEQPRST